MPRKSETLPPPSIIHLSVPWTVVGAFLVQVSGADAVDSGHRAAALRNGTLPGRDGNEGYRVGGQTVALVGGAEPHRRSGAPNQRTRVSLTRALAPLHPHREGRGFGLVRPRWSNNPHTRRGRGGGWLRI
ncbi:hypothetical protein PBY51_005659 [Eleginops maclovinus]|uniref:Uncharacterized protein n=1 Tax=Eleginops maclovinus TaxID=56733 RepID=A0AAN7WMM7_ELEMC|nr:hypothetical protein PBY51_005659 [Eleginops maclovinus]